MTELTAFTKIITPPGPPPPGPDGSLVEDLEQAVATALLIAHFVYAYDHEAEEPLFVSAGVEELLGERPAARELTPAWLAARVHPDDAMAVQQAQALVGAYLHQRGLAHAPLPNFLFSIDYRLRHANGRYRRVLHQWLLLERAPGPGSLRRSLLLFTDITHHKLTHEVRSHVNQPDFAAFAAAARPAPVIAALTGREQQILALVLQGLTSRQIAYRLQLRESTIKTHRRNLLRKAGTHGFHELFRHLGPANTA